MCFLNHDSDDTKKRAQQLVDKDPNGDLQEQKVSAFSPGPVLNDEVLARSVEYPAKWASPAGINETLFQDGYGAGASAQRLIGGWTLCKESVHQRFEKRAEARRSGSDGRVANLDFVYIGAVHIQVGALRACQLPGDEVKRVRVYDAGTELEDPYHADVILNVADLSKAQKKELRLRLMTLATKDGLYVSPFLSGEEMERAMRSEVKINLPTCEQAE